MTENVASISPVEEVIQPQEVAAPETNANEGEQKYSPEIVTKIVKREREKAYEKGKREAMMEMQQQMQQAGPANEPAQAAQPAVAAPQQPQVAHSIGGMPQITPDQIQKMIAEHAPQVFGQYAQQLKQKNLVDSFVNKMQAAETKYPGLEKKLSELDFSTLTPVIGDINDMDNAGDIMNELLENPMKLGNVVALAYSQPHLAKTAIKSLSASIKMNEEAKAAEKSSQDPFSQQRPSLNAGKDDGDMSVADFQAMFRKRRK